MWDGNSSTHSLILKCSWQTCDHCHLQLGPAGSVTLHCPAGKRSGPGGGLRGPSPASRSLCSGWDPTGWVWVLKTQTPGTALLLKVLGPQVCLGLSFLSFKTEQWKTLWRGVGSDSQGTESHPHPAWISPRWICIQTRRLPDSPGSEPVLPSHLG